MTFSGQGLQSNEGGFLFKPLGFCNLPELVPLSQQTWSKNSREELGACESSAAEGPWEVHSTAEVWFAHPDPNRRQSAPFVTASLSPCRVCQAQLREQGCPCCSPPSHGGSTVSWSTGRGWGCATVLTLLCGLRFNAASRVQTWR